MSMWVVVPRVSSVLYWALVLLEFVVCCTVLVDLTVRTLYQCVGNVICCNLCVCCIICPNYPAVFLIYFISAAVSNNPPSFILWDLPLVRISPEWVRSPEQGSLAVGLLRLSYGQTCFGVAFPALLMKQLYCCDLVVTASLWEQGVAWEVVGDCWVGEAMVLCIATVFTLLSAM